MPSLIAMLACSALLLVILYRLDKRGIGDWKPWILVGFLAFNSILLPLPFRWMLIAQMKADDFQCGMPLMGLHLSFWVLGNLFLLLTYVFYTEYRRLFGKGKGRRER